MYKEIEELHTLHTAQGHKLLLNLDANERGLTLGKLVENTINAMQS